MPHAVGQKRGVLTVGETQKPWNTAESHQPNSKIGGLVGGVSTKPPCLDTILKRGSILVGTTGDYKPFSYFNEKRKEFEGLDIDAATKLGEDLGVAVRFVKTTWKALTQGILDGQYEIAMGGITRNLKRQKEVYLTDPYIDVGKCPLIRKTDMDQFKIFADIDQPGVKIGVNPGGTNEEFVRANIKKAGIKVIENNLDIPGDITSGKIDVMITDNIEAMLVAGHNPLLYAISPQKPLTKDDFAYMVPRGDLAFLAWMNLWVRQMHRTGGYAALYVKWISKTLSGPEPRKKTLEKKKCTRMNTKYRSTVKYSIAFTS